MLAYNYLNSLFKSELLLLFVESCSFIVTCSIIIYCTLKFYKNPKSSNTTNKTFFFFIITIFSVSVENLAWIIKLIESIDLIQLTKTRRFFILLAWIFDMVKYQSLGLFLESLTENNFRLKKHHKMFFAATVIFSTFFIYTGVCVIILNQPIPPIHFIILPIIPLYSLITAIPSLYIALFRIFKEAVPNLIKTQLKIIFIAIIIPYYFFDLLQTYPIIFYAIFADNITGAIMSNIFLTSTLIFFAKNIFNFRFLNVTRHISTNQTYFNNGNLKEVIEKISNTSYIEELLHITQSYFRSNFNISESNIHLHVRKIYSGEQSITEKSIKNLQLSIENFISNPDHKTDPIEVFKENKIIVLDEVEFNAFYTSNLASILLTQFLKSINCSLFMPIFYKNELIAYITIKQENNNHLFNLNAQNDVYVLSTYLAHMIHIISTTNPQTILQESQQLKQELFLKHQEVNQYKESMKNLLQKNVQHAAGIIFYKNNSFFFGNKAAQDLVNINLNQQKNHPITHALREIAHQVIMFKSTQQRFLATQNNDKLLITGIPHFETKNSVIFTIQYPEASDIIKQNLSKLQNPSKWDYALYLETTESGKLINRMIPSNQEQFFNFKIKLLEAALTHKGLLLQCHPDDLNAITELIHHVSLKENLHVIDLQGSEEKDIYIKLFGINHLFQKTFEQPLLQKLDKIGTLLIKNVEQLDKTTQKELANFIKYGYFSPFKSHDKIFSSVRIICSTNQQPQNLIERGILLPTLYDQLQSTILKMPSLVTLKKEEIQELADGVTSQTVKDTHFNNIIQLSEDDYKNIVDRKPASLKELKSNVHHLIAKKTNKHTMFTETTVDRQFETSNPDLLHAAQLGKYALKDEKLMALLWNTFKSQSKIAQFLGVNRSSINRRCKEYSLN